MFGTKAHFSSLRKSSSVSNENGVPDERNSVREDGQRESDRRIRRAGVGSMSNPVVLITGALTGIGRAAALAFAKEGARLVVAGRHEEAGQELAKELHALGAEAEFIRADVRHDDEVR